MSSKSDSLDLVNVVLRNINKETVSPIYEYRLDRKFLNSTEVILSYKPHSNIIFIRPQKEYSRLLDSLSSQLNALSPETYFNPRARFVIVVTGYCSKTTDFLPKGIDMLWSRFKVENFVIMVPNLNQSQYGINENVHGLLKVKDCDIYSWFPHETHHCGELFKAVLVNMCYAENGGELLHNVQLFLNKIPNNFAGCSMSALVPNIEPYSVGVINVTVPKTVFNFKGVLTDYFMLVAVTLNLTFRLSPITQSITDLQTVDAQIIILPLNPYTSKCHDLTIPYALNVMQWYVSCPTFSLGIIGVFGVYNCLSGWL
jgi:hypothetical protein